MAIIEGLQNFNVTIQVEGQTATEYAPTSDRPDSRSNAPSTSCYIEAKSGKLFSIVIAIDKEKLLSSESCVAADVVIDGHKADCKVARRHCDLSSGPSTTFSISGRTEISKTSNNLIEKPFMFKKILRVEDSGRERVETDLQISKCLGEIVVRLYACAIRTILPARANSPIPEVESLAAKAMKGRDLSHKTTYAHGQELPISCKGFSEVETNGLIGEFTFNYRSKEALQREMIIPAPPVPSVPEQLDKMSSEEIRQLAEEMLKLKQEVKQEQDSSTLSRKRVVDLTDDDLQVTAGQSPSKVMRRDYAFDTRYVVSGMSR